MQKVNKQEVIKHISILKLTQEKELDLCQELFDCVDKPWDLFQVLSDHGDVEAVYDDGLIYGNGNNDVVFEYINAGDTYASTFVYDRVRGALYLATIGDCIEYAQQYGLTSCDDDSEYIKDEIKQHIDLYGLLSISHGTMRNEDLIPALLSFCIRLNPEKTREYFGLDAYKESFEYWDEDCEVYEDAEKASGYLDSLYDCLDSILYDLGFCVQSLEGDASDVCILPLDHDEDCDDEDNCDCDDEDCEVCND